MRVLTVAALMMAVPVAVAALPAAAGAAPDDATPRHPVASTVAPQGATRLHLSAEGSVPVTPDLLVADLEASDTNFSAAAAQNRVNELMATGRKLARAVPDLDVRAVGYTVRRADGGPTDEASSAAATRPRWYAEQTLELRAHQDGSEGLLSAVGRLQDLGFAGASVDWRVSPEVEDNARDQAMVAALHSLQARAADAAAALSLKVDHLQDVRVERRTVFPMRAMAAPAMAPMALPVQATASAQPITSTVSADILLTR